jgi:hypothetical protein
MTKDKLLKNKALKLLLLAFFLIGFFNLGTESLFSYSCLPGYCQSPGGILGPGNYWKGGDKEGACVAITKKEEYSCSGTDSACFGGYWYWTNSSCTECDKDPDENICFQGCCGSGSGGCEYESCDECEIDCSDYPSYPNTSCDTSTGGTCTHVTKSCKGYDNCGDECNSDSDICYSDPVCPAACQESGFKYYATEPVVSTEIIDKCLYKYTNCSTAEKCYKCSVGCPCTSGTYAASQPADTYIPAECTLTDSLCNTSTQNCYYDCPDVTCADLPARTDGPWLDTCTPDATDRCVRVDNIEVPIPKPTSPAPMAGKPYNCATSEVKTCYYKSALPQVDSLIALPGDYSGVLTMTQVDNSPLLSRIVSRVSAQSAPEDEVKGFTSTTHTGQELNNPVKLEGVYSDPDGSQDIMALYVWWSPRSSKTFITPTNLNDALAGRTANQANFGLLISRDYDTGNWTNVYVPHIDGSNQSWRRAGTVSQTITVRSSNGMDLSRVYDITVTNNSDGSGSNSNSVFLEMYMLYFSPDDTSINDIPVTQKYNLWASVNDQAGYLPFNPSDYPDIAYNIIESGDEFWEDRGNDWELDLVRPVNKINSMTNAETDLESYQVEVDINANDEDETSGASNEGRIAYIRLDACKSGDDDILNLKYDDGSGDGDSNPEEYILKDCDAPGVIDGEDVFVIPDMTSGDSLLGDLGGNPSNPLDALEEDLTANVFLNGNKDGSITFYLTTMDMAGNISEQYSDIYLLEQWGVTEEGLVFGQRGVNISTRDREADPFSAHPVLTKLTSEPDLTNQVLLGGAGINMNTNLVRLVKTSVNKSFKAMNFPGILMTSVYTELTEAYERKSNNSEFYEGNISVNTIGGTLKSPASGLSCDKDYCIWKWSADPIDPDVPLTISSGFECNAKGLIIANGNVVIRPQLENASDSDACIILANGTITIEEGTEGERNDNSEPFYDKVEAFIITSRGIEVPGEGGETPDDDGLFVEGGLVGFGEDGMSGSTVYSTRELRYNYMDFYPVLVVKGNSKYGLLSRTLFGSQIDIFKRELGYKPY